MIDDQVESEEASEQLREKQLLDKLDALGLSHLGDKVWREGRERRLLDARLEIANYELGEHLDELRLERLWNSITDMQVKAYDQGARYNNVVLTLGYAGFFGIWSLVKDSLTEKQSGSVAILLGISLIIFIGWTVANSIVLLKMTKQTVAVHAPKDRTIEERIFELDALAVRLNSTQIDMMSYYPLVFGSSLITGMMAGVILLFTLGKKLLIG